MLRRVAGIVNLRGRIVTIIDLGLRLGFPPVEPRAENRIFIMEDRNEFIGLLVDRVDEVVEIERDQWQPPPASVNRGQARLPGVCAAGQGDHAPRRRADSRGNGQ
jgi:purine-binding chemotaxis protein CheW